MSLQVWLPLNGDLHNQGLTNISITNNGTTINNNGKIGKCCEFGTSKYIKLMNYASTFLTYTEWSLSVWFKCTAQNTSHSGSALISSGNWNSAPNLLNLALYNFSSDHYTKLIISNSNSWHDGYSYNFYLNQWYHVVLTSGNGKTSAYVNGQLIGNSFPAYKPNSLEQSWVTIGNGTYTTVFQFYGLMNDVRIYDHCLSAKEVEEISRGLILHYKLDNNGVGNENILTNSTGYMGKQYWAGLVTVGNENNFPYLIAKRTDTTTNGRTFCYHNVITSMVSSWSAGDKFTISGYYKVPSSETQDVVGNLFIRWQKSSGSHSDTGFNTESPNTVIKDTWIRFENTFTVPTGWDNTKTVEFHLSAFSKGLATIYWKQIKLEKGEKATSWIPAKTDSNYFIGIDNTIYDSSGYGNHGIISGSLITSTLSARYECSSYFDGNTSAVQTPNLATMITDKNYTISCWIYKMQIGSKNYQTIYGGPPGFELEARNSNSTSPLFRLHNWGGGTTPYEFNKWYHFCFVHSNTDSKLYINGELKIIGSSINVPPSGNYFIGAWNTSTQQNYDGNISDFRIYCTVLSEDQVKELYDTSVTIDNLGNAYARELVE